MNKKTCFVVSIIGNENSEERRHANNVLKHIIEPSLSNDFKITRADTIYHSDKIDEKIFEYLKKSDLVVADLTGNNPNVFLEVGYRLALGLPTIYLIQKSENKLPFDIQNLNIIHYDIKSSNVLDEVSTAKERLSQTAKSLQYQETQPLHNGEETQLNPLSEILMMLYNIDDKIDNLSLEISTSNGEDFQNQMNFKIMEMAMNNPEKFEKLAHIMNNNPKIFPQK